MPSQNLTVTSPLSSDVSAFSSHPSYKLPVSGVEAQSIQSNIATRWLRIDKWTDWSSRSTNSDEVDQNETHLSKHWRSNSIELMSSTDNRIAVSLDDIAPRQSIKKKRSFKKSTVKKFSYVHHGKAWRNQKFPLLLCHLFDIIYMGQLNWDIIEQHHTTID